MNWLDRIEGVLHVVTVICVLYVLVIFGWFIRLLSTDSY